MSQDLLSLHVSPILFYMGKRILLFFCLLFSSVAFAQNAPTAVDIANLREDIKGLLDKINDLTLKVEQLETENAQLRHSNGSANQSYVTHAQLQDVISELKLAIQTSKQSTKDEVLNRATSELETPAKKTGASNEALSNQNSRTLPQGNFSTDFSKEGTTYVVQRGDTLALIAKKNSAKSKDIINANKLSDPSRIYVGQTLFIPGAK